MSIMDSKSIVETYQETKSVLATSLISHKSQKRVHQILVDAGLKDGKRCAKCGKALYSQNNTYCIQCWIDLSFQGIVMTCDYCGKTKKVNRQIQKHRQKANYKHFFCSHSCGGHWLHLSQEEKERRILLKGERND